MKVASAGEHRRCPYGHCDHLGISSFRYRDLCTSVLLDYDGGLKSAAGQQGGAEVLMLVLMVMAPPMAALFFNGALGQFVANTSFGNVVRNSSAQTSDFKQDYFGRDSDQTVKGKKK